MQQHAANLVARQQMENTFIVPDGHTQPVTVRVSGENHACPHLIGQLEGKGIGAGILRIRHLDGGEVGIRHFLFLDYRHVGNTDFFQDAADRHIAAAVQGGVDDGQGSPFLGQHFRLNAQGLHLGDVIIVHFLVADDVQQPLGLGFFLIHQGAIFVIQCTNKPGNAFRRFRANLCTILAVHFIAVILGRIVAGGNHHACNGMQMANRIGKDRHRAKSIKQIGRHAFLAQHQSRIFGKFRRAAAAVIGNGYAPLCFFRVLHQVLRQALGGTAHIVAVHAVGAGTQHTPHAGRTERKLRIKPILNFLGIVGD